MSERVLFRFPAEIQMVMDYDPDTGTISVTEAVVVPDQFLPIDHRSTTTYSVEAAQAAITWAEENNWPEPKLSADGIDLSFKTEEGLHD